MGTFSKLRLMSGAALAALVLMLDAQVASAQIETVVVTAEKRSESLQTVPDAVTAISSDRLTLEHANGLTDYFRQIPSLSMAQGSQGNTQLTIRGINSSAFTGPTVGIYVDDTPIGTSVSGDHANLLVPDLDPSDLSRIEVLRGPQGTLYGAAAMGGLLKYVTALPDLEKYSGRVEVDGSNVDDGGWGYVARGAATGPIVDDVLAFRVSAYARLDPGFIDDPGVISTTSTNQHLSDPPRKDVNSDEVYGGHASLLWQINPDATLKLSALYQNTHGDGQTAEDINGETQQPTHGDLVQIDSRFTGPYNVRLQVYNAALNWNFGWSSLLSSSSYAINDFGSITDITGLVPPSPTSGFPPGGPVFPNAGPIYFTYPLNPGPASYFTPVLLHYRTGKFTQEVRLTSPSDQTIEWLVGAFFTHEDTTGDQRINIDNNMTGAQYPITGVCAPPFGLPSPPFPPFFSAPCLGTPVIFGFPATAPAGTPFHRSDSRDGYTELAGFADVTWHVTDALSVQGGIRYSGNWEDFASSFSGALDALSAHTYSGSAAGKGSSSKATYLVSPKYQITDNTMIYARFATGYRPGGANADLPGTPLTFRSDSTENYEVGVKSSLFDNRLVLDGDVYAIHWNNIQLQTTSPQDFFYFVNGKTARSDGFELEATALPIPELTIQGNVAYDDAVLTAPAPATANIVTHAGDRIPYTPEWSGDISADYTVPVAADWTAHIGGDEQFVGSEFDNFYPTTAPRAHLKAYEVTNLRLGVAKDDWDVTLFVKNAFDKRAFIQESVQHDTFALSIPGGRAIPDSATPITPRVIGISIAKKFD